MDNGDIYARIEELLAADDIEGAQNLLDDINERGGRWHYLESEVFKRKNWLNECRKQLEIAVRLEPDNVKYRDALSKLAYKGSGEEPKEKKSKRKRNMGGTDDASATLCATCCFECACQGLCEAIFEGCS